MHPCGSACHDGIGVWFGRGREQEEHAIAKVMVKSDSGGQTQKLLYRFIAVQSLTRLRGSKLEQKKKPRQHSPFPGAVLLARAQRHFRYKADKTSATSPILSIAACLGYFWRRQYPCRRLLHSYLLLCLLARFRGS